MIAQKESLKKLPGFMQAPTSAMKMKVVETKKKQHARKNGIDGRKIGRLQKTGELIGTSFRSTVLDTMKVPLV